MIARGLGYRKDPHDARDRLFSAHRVAAERFPEFATVDKSFVAPKNQGPSSTCVGQAISQGLRLAYLAKGIQCPELSALSVYRGALNIDGVNEDVGTYTRSGMRAVRERGVAAEQAWPFNADPERVIAQLPFNVLHDAYERGGARSYHRIVDSDETAWCRAIAYGMPVASGWDINRHFLSADGREVFDVQQGEIAGGHEMLVVSYGPSSHFERLYPAFRPGKSYPLLFALLGSWGAEYGYNGRILVTPEFVCEAHDSWALATEVA